MTPPNPILHVVGARPNFMKAAPVIAALDRRSTPQLLVHTGQHYDTALSQVFFDELGLPRPDVNLGVGSGSHAAQTAALLVGLESVLIETAPARVIVYGDVNSTLAAALAAAKLHFPIAHVEAGLRSFDRTMPEEVNRIVTDALSDLHFVTSEEAIGHLMREGVDEGSIHFVGNPMIDTLLRFRDTLDLPRLQGDLDLPDDYAVVTLHRPSNVDDPSTAAGLVTALRSIAEQIPLIFPLHPRSRRPLSDAGLEPGPTLRIMDPLPYVPFIGLVAGARLVLTDSGGIQEETTVLGIPCLTLRTNTERPVTVSHGTNTLAGTDPSMIVALAFEKLQVKPPDVAALAPPLWDGSAGARIAEILTAKTPTSG